MSPVRQAEAGTTRSCPHCRTTILDSSTICPACKKYLRFDPAAGTRGAPSFVPLKVEGSVRHPNAGEAWEYTVVVSIKNERGEEINRQVVGVGALQPDEARTFAFSVEVFTPKP